MLGNLGLNSYLTATSTEPARLYVADFFSTGTLKQILTFFKGGVSYPVAGRDDLVRLMPALRQRYPSYRSFGAARVEDILPAAELADRLADLPVLEVRDAFVEQLLRGDVVGGVVGHGASLRRVDWGCGRAQAGRTLA